MKRKRKVLIDSSNIFYMTFYSLIGKKKITEESQEEFFNYSINLWKHLILNNIICYARRFKVDIKDIILCFDSKYTWRHQMFKYYKKGRKKSRKDSGIDFKKFFATMEEFKKELNENFPIMSLEVEMAEADDIIYVLTEKLSKKYDITIVSMDKDLVQVLKFDNVKFFRIKFGGKGKYMNINKKQLKPMLEHHILMGDRADGIPNVLSDEDTFVTEGKRQKPLGEKKADKIIKEGITNYLKSDYYQSRYIMNAKLIDMKYIPEDIVKAIEKLCIKEMTKDSSWKKAIAWLKENKMQNILNDLEKDFIKDSMDTLRSSVKNKWAKKLVARNQGDDLF